MASLIIEAPEATAPRADVFNDAHYASTVWQKLKRSFQLGPKYYTADLPRYYCNRRALGLTWWDFGAFTNPLREIRRRSYHSLPLPTGYVDALHHLRDAGIRLTMPPADLEALLGAWWSVRDLAGDVIECGAYRGATSLLIAVLGRMNDLPQTVLMLDTFNGMPTPSAFDVARPGEFTPDANQVECIARQAQALEVEGRIEVHPGLFSDTFASFHKRSLRFSFVHIDANIYQSTWEACRFTIPRTVPGGAVVFDDYNGVCDLGARLAIEQYCVGRKQSLVPLSGSSAVLWI